jgi:hypothetical protein
LRSPRHGGSRGHDRRPKIIRAKGGVLEPAKQLVTSQACKMMSYRSRVAPEIEGTVVALAI